MTAFDRGRTLAERFRAHAGDSVHLYGYAMRGLAEDWEAGGPVRQVCAGHEDAPERSALQLRLLAGVFRLVLTGQAPDLQRFYPSLGGFDHPADAWPVMRRVIAEHVEELRVAVRIAPQTNEVGRSAALLAGLFDLVEETGCTQIRLLELGASAGLNLLLEQYGFSGDNWQWGSQASPVQLKHAIVGPLPPRNFHISSRRGCDLHPVDVSTAEGRVLLTSFVWPFDLHRHERLAAALRVAVSQPAAVDQASASEWIPSVLAAPAAHAGTLTVVWHSITQLYWPQVELDRVSDALASHGARQPLAEIAMEYNPSAPEGAKPEVVTQLWRPGHPAGIRRRMIGTAHDHGLPVRLTDAE